MLLTQLTEIAALDLDVHMPEAAILVIDGAILEVECDEDDVSAADR